MKMGVFENIRIILLIFMTLIKNGLSKKKNYCPVFFSDLQLSGFLQIGLKNFLCHFVIIFFLYNALDLFIYLNYVQDVYLNK
jgi:hypothetical protein